jgi:hypothetical protein
MDQEEFYQKIPEWINHDRDRWNHITLMAYFCHKYELKNGTRFRLVRWKSDPGKGKESRDFSKLIELFLPEKYEELSLEEKKIHKTNVIQKIYNYINWMFDYKFRSGDKSVTGTQLFLMPSMINEFERMYSSFLQRNLSKDKIEVFLDAIKREYPEIFERHQLDEVSDLKILERYIENYKLPESSLEAMVIAKAKTMEII